MPSLNKKELIAEVARRNPSVSVKDVTSVLSSVFEVILEVLADRGEVRWAGFGNFLARLSKEREGRNPQTGEKTLIEAKWKPVLKWALNAKKQVAE